MTLPTRKIWWRKSKKKKRKSWSRENFIDQKSFAKPQSDFHPKVNKKNVFHWIQVSVVTSQVLPCARFPPEKQALSSNSPSASLILSSTLNLVPDVPRVQLSWRVVGFILKSCDFDPAGYCLQPSWLPILTQLLLYLTFPASQVFLSQTGTFLPFGSTRTSFCLQGPWVKTS